ncbi:hypothetical protein [Rickettsiella endosymbiont of Aleochara curtula]|uniref:hypothetical protein n=1 Tax=Rickettsiella endosymbiont of Aleochara curtula TaxID=3077936 RepID=UPI00313EB69D
MIVEEKKIPKDESLKNSTYNGTDKWMKSTEVIKLTTRNGGASITDEIPGGGMVQQRIAAQEKQIQSNKLQLINSISNSSTITSSSSEFSIPSQSSSENGSVRQEKLREYKIPTLSRRNTKASLFSNNSRNENPKIFKFDIEGRLIILSQAHPFLKNIDPKRRKVPQSYRNAFRIDNLTDKELQDLTDNYLNKAIAVGKPNFRA